jgi:predicted pyridoxine 5'-phosphate oxidase superfamily flavin-nucleotide-binding protein
MPDALPADSFHSGERILQERFGSRARVAGSRAIRSELPPPFQVFISQLNLVFLGSIDASGQPWVTALTGNTGFIRSIDPTRLEIDALPSGSHPLAELAVGKPAAVLAIDFARRSRIRINGQISLLERSGFVVDLWQAYGNCPQYITPRRLDGHTGTLENYQEVPLTDPTIRRIVERADTFVIASYVTREDGSIDMDVSHRGGSPGFVQYADGELSWPEYRGNFYFNTLGNLFQNPTCGLLIPDFASGEALLLTGRASMEGFDGVVHSDSDGLPRLGAIRCRPMKALYSPPASH